MGNFNRVVEAKDVCVVLGAEMMSCGAEKFKDDGKGGAAAKKGKWGQWQNLFLSVDEKRKGRC